MIITEINAVDYGSTGKIMLQIAQCARNKGHEVHTFSVSYGKKQSAIPDHQYYSSYFFFRVHRRLAMYTGFNGLFSVLPTLKLLYRLKKIKPDIIHLHNLHGFCISLPLLFRFIKKNNCRVIWTLHDCWSFTGKCPHYLMVGCDRWKTGCHHCSQLDAYPFSRVDVTKQMWKLKKSWFTGIEEMTIVTPSRWLAEQVKASYLKDYSVKVINNGIDLDVFRPSPSDFRQRRGISKDKFILLGIAFDWGIRKGLDVFIELSRRLDDRFQVVLVGTDKAVDRQLPDNIISIHRTQDQKELAEIYTAADLFVNPTREDNYPTVNMEAIACGTPVLSFRTGGSPEIVAEGCGIIVDCDDTDGLEQAIRDLYVNAAAMSSNCIKQAVNYDKETKFEEYVNLYEKNDRK